MAKQKKIDAAIKVAKNKLENAKHQVNLWNREKEVLQDQVDTLEGLKANDHFE